MRKELGGDSCHSFHGVCVCVFEETDDHPPFFFVVFTHVMHGRQTWHTTHHVIQSQEVSQVQIGLPITYISMTDKGTKRNRQMGILVFPPTVTMQQTSWNASSNGGITCHTVL